MTWHPELSYAAATTGEEERLRMQIAVELVIAAERLHAQETATISRVLASTMQKDLSPALSAGRDKATFFIYERVKTNNLKVPFYAYDEQARILDRDLYGKMKVVPIETITAINSLRNILHNLSTSNQLDA